MLPPVAILCGGRGTRLQEHPQAIPKPLVEIGGRPHRVLDVVTLICRLAGTGVSPDVRGAGTPLGEIDCQWVDATKLRELTGREPLVGLEEGRRRTLAWYRDHC